MTAVAFAILIVIVAFLLCYVVDLAQVAPPINSLMKALVILIAVILIIHQAGLL